MRLLFITLYCLVGLSLTISAAEKSGNETKTQTLENVDFGETELKNKTEDIQRKRESGYNYNKPIRYNRPQFRSKNRGQFSKHRNQLNRPFTLYGPPKTQEENLNLNQHQEPIQTPDNLHQAVPNPVKNYEFPERDPVPDQNDLPFRIDTANYLPPKNQKLPVHSPLSFSASQDQKNQQHLTQNYLQDQRISDATLFLTQNSKLLSQLYRAPASNQEYAPNNEYFGEATNQHQGMGNHHNSHVESTGSQIFPRPSYASGILNPREMLENIQSLEKDRLIAQLRQALENQAQYQDSVPLGRNAPIIGNVYQATGNEAGSLGNQQLVSPSVFGGDRFASFLSGSAISPSGFKVTYGLPASSQGSTATIRPPGPVAADSKPTGSSGSIAPGSFDLGSFGIGAIRPGTGSVEPGTVGTGSVGTGTIGTGLFGTGSVRPGTVGTGSVGPGTVGIGSVGPGTIGTGLFGTGSVRPGTVGTGSVGPGTVGTGSIGPGTLGTGSIGPGTIGTGSFKPGLEGSGYIPNFPQYGTYVPTLIPGTNFIANIPIPGSNFLGSNLVPVSSSSPTHFAIPIPVSPDQRPISGMPTLTINKPEVPISGPGHSIVSPFYPINSPVHPLRPAAIPVHPIANPSHPVASPVQPVHSIATPVHPVVNPLHPVATPVQPIHQFATPGQPIRPVTAPTHPEVTPIHPTYGIQSNFLNSLFIKPFKPVFPVYYYPNVQVQIPKPALTTHPWNYAPTYQQPKPNWKR